MDGIRDYHVKQDKLDSEEGKPRFSHILRMGMFKSMKAEAGLFAQRMGSIEEEE